MKRRGVTLLCGAAAAWPLAADAQQSGKLPTIGLLLGAATASSWHHWVAAFTRRRLRELGWTEGRSVAIEYRWAEGRSERYAEIAAEFVRLKVDIIVTSGGGRGRDGDFCSPAPAQIPAGAANAPGSHLG